MDDQVTDAALEREIESLLASEPSPEFLAQVRTRVGEEPEPGVWRPSWMFAVPGAVALVIVAVLVSPSSEPTSPSLAPAPSPRVAEAVAPTSVRPASPPTIRPGRARAAAAAAQDRGIDLVLPEVVIADNEVKTFAALVASVRQRRFDVAVPAAPAADAALEIAALPPVEPLEIEPIVKLAALQSEGERP